MKAETKIKDVKRISELTAKEEQFFKEKYGQQMYDRHIKHDNMVELIIMTDIVPFLGKFSDRFEEARARDKAKNE